MNVATDKVRVLIVDDSSFMRNILSRMIERHPRLEVVGKATNGQEGVAMAQELKPDVVTMDIEMPVMNGLDALKAIMQSNPRPVVMVSSLTSEGAQATLDALSLGAVDFIPKAMEDNAQNILRRAEDLHAKLLAAASAKMQAATRPMPSKPAPMNLVPGTQTPPVGAPVAPPPAAAPAPAATGARLHKLEKAKLLLIGSSTGGPRALQTLLGALPAKMRVPIVITQHMPANFTAAMAARLDEQFALTVREAADGMLLENGVVYIAPGGTQTRIERKGTQLTFSVQPDQGESLFKPSVSVIAKSVMDVLGPDVLAVMLTGMGSDGAKEYAELRQRGAYVIAQDQATCVVYGMPKAVVDLGAANEVLPLERIAPQVGMLLQ